MISIHALLAESDKAELKAIADRYISIHALLAESDVMLSGVILTSALISIHALLAESDGIGLVFLWWGVRFLSTLSLRRATPMEVPQYQILAISIHALLAESDYDTSSLMQCQARFLSTLSLRRATVSFA